MTTEPALNRSEGFGKSTENPGAATHEPGEPDGTPEIHPQRPPDPKVEEVRRKRNPVQRFLKVLGPGLVTGASDDDPSGIGTYAQAGARFGYSFLWATLVMLPMMISVQYICAKIGLVSGRGLAGVMRQHYPRAVLYPAVIAMVLANSINAGADIGAVAAAINLLVPVPAIFFIVPVGAAILAVQVFGSYHLIERIFKWLAMALLAYIAAALLAHPNVADLVKGTVIPSIHLDSAWISMLVALLGTTISPYLFFWQASHEVEEEVAKGRTALWQRRGATRDELKLTLWDTIAGMAFSEVVAYFIILATAATLFTQGQTDIGSATDAAQALRPVAGDASAVLLAVGLIGAGVLAIPILTGSAAYGVSELFGWKLGLNERPDRAPQFYGVIVLATLIGVGINFLGINPIDALVISAVVNGLLAAPILVLVMLVSNNRAVMGHATNGRLLNFLGWFTAGAMGLAAVALIISSF